ncbi:furin-like protease 1 isoform X1 [Lucilia sericata]|uniref:furin-like protease 1 isoform X1 n=1 Tax=Lucilia sericata TaxID=13632 RepID=UPI0018A84ED7|nr:furin-like protease 1 isoform X1 [Lucilia sericata]XP_037816404.1 furin-like protease 1 isoform X1 [Lucilia sericata]XP_037816405.1 furin-like protease 1 isoform X1 [Lucilia sericata]
MQNDVVRWSSTICNLYSCNNKHIYANNNKLYKRTVHKLCSCKEEKDKNVDKTTSHELLSTIAFNESKNLSVKCDTNVYDLYLVQDIVNSSRFLKKDKSQKYFYQQLNGGKGRRRSNNNIYNSYGTRLLFLLQLSVLVILCSLNIGFVTSANLEEKVLPSSDTHKFIHGLHEEESLNNIGGHYTHTWAVHIPDGDKDGKAEKVANDHGFINLGRIFDDHYHFAHRKVSKRSLTAALSHQIRLDEDDRVSWAQQQIAKSRRKRDFIHMRPSRTSSISAYSMVDAVPFNDPKWPQMWYLNRGGDLDMNVIPAWKEGITGKGIVVTILDDGLESDHPDIISNYDPKASYDVNSHDPDPMPHYDLTDSNRHGTRCAGEVAATANNTICAVGIAFGASVGGVRMLDGDVTDAVEARSLSLNPQHIDIYSASWGPDDDGKTVDGPGELASRAFIEGVTKGRNGKGSIFIWASGNGGRELDNCNCDGYTNSIWTLSISSATEEGHVPWYSEKCSSTLATTYSSGSQTEKQVVTTDLHHSCTVSHTGTSASAPLAAGIAALVLESNTNLTWRDLQHIVVRTAKPANLIDPNWSKNGVGRRVSHSFGYGLMDASAMVRLARNWKTVPEQQRCEINAPHVDKVIPPKGHITLQLSVKNCLNINFLEHVQAKITLTSQRRGDIQLNLISPAGTKVTLLTPRVHDTSHSGFNQWPFMSVHTWGESPHGNWQLEIHNEGRYMAQITQWDLIFYGTEIPAQPDDPTPSNSKQFSPFRNDMVHNDIDYEPNDQWNNMQQMGKPSMMTHDRTNTSCVKTTINQQCLACAPPNLFYRGRCYDICPIRTYALSHINRESDTLENNEEINRPKNLQDEEELQSIDRKKRSMYLYGNTSKTGAYNRKRADSTVNNIVTLSCEPCDKSCLQCYGPLSSQCSSCSFGRQLKRMKHTNETYCINFSERSSGNAFTNSSTREFNIKSIMLILVPSIIIVLLGISFATYRKGKCLLICRRELNDNEDIPTYTYDRVALFADEDNQEDDDDLKSHTCVIKMYTDDNENDNLINN